MKPFTAIFCYVIFFSCSRDPHVMLSLVNADNDGFNAFSIYLHDDSTYTIDDDLSNNKGRFTIDDTVIYFDGRNSNTKKLVYNKTSSGCLYNVRYVSENKTTDMRVISDSLYCKSVVRKNLAGIWKCDLTPYGTDTLKLYNNNTAQWRGEYYPHWKVHNAELTLSGGGYSHSLLILDIRNDTLWYNSQTIPNILEPTKAIRISQAE
jgi:hypothetical protein